MALFYRAVVTVLKGLTRLCYRHRTVGCASLPDEGAILAANHTSYLDPILIGVSWPEPLHFLARDSLFRWPLFSLLIRSLNAHPLKSGGGSTAALKAAVRLVKQQKKILIFPQGTRTDTEEIGQLRAGVALLAARSETAIIPIYVHGAHTAWNRFRRLPKLWGRTACYIGEPLRWSDFSDLPRDEAMKTMTQRLQEALELLRQQALQDEA